MDGDLFGTRADGTGVVAGFDDRQRLVQLRGSCRNGTEEITAV
ncbi:hypothetical protein CLV92_10476 [Kineococcus xinjiangensis]|uniref:Uncharacterized protein n=1 Tax=Kineococcus xinjiangensis TaxID=512762 RepID=A0A2S6ISP9_9ACTN|nr:hypothetical protein CLV92_10476 [Kineococcus xinjiangensis]